MPLPKDLTQQCNQPSLKLRSNKGHEMWDLRFLFSEAAGQASLVLSRTASSLRAKGEVIKTSGGMSCGKCNHHLLEFVHATISRNPIETYRNLKEHTEILRVGKV